MDDQENSKAVAQPILTDERIESLWKLAERRWDDQRGIAPSKANIFTGLIEADLRASLSAPKAAPVEPMPEAKLRWQQSVSLLYVLRDGTNFYEVNVTMAAGSRRENERCDFAERLLATITGQKNGEPT